MHKRKITQEKKQKIIDIFVVLNKTMDKNEKMFKKIAQAVFWDENKSWVVRYALSPLFKHEPQEIKSDPKYEERMKHFLQNKKRLCS